METYVLTEGAKILYAIAAGLALGTVYALISLIRTILRCGAVLTALSDLLFGIFSALAVFAFTFIFNSGVLRAYIILSVIAGTLTPLLLLRKLRMTAKHRIIKKGLAADVHRDVPQGTET